MRLVLTALKCDLRKDEFENPNPNAITYEQGLAKAKEISAVKYLGRPFPPSLGSGPVTVLMGRQNAPQCRIVVSWRRSTRRPRLRWRSRPRARMAPASGASYCNVLWSSPRHLVYPPRLALLLRQTSSDLGSRCRSLFYISVSGLDVFVSFLFFSFLHLLDLFIVYTLDASIILYS